MLVNPNPNYDLFIPKPNQLIFILKIRHKRSHDKNCLKSSFPVCLKPI